MNEELNSNMGFDGPIDLDGEMNWLDKRLYRRTIHSLEERISDLERVIRYLNCGDYTDEDKEACVRILERINDKEAEKCE